MLNIFLWGMPKCPCAHVSNSVLSYHRCNWFGIYIRIDRMILNLHVCCFLNIGCQFVQWSARINHTLPTYTFTIIPATFVWLHYYIDIDLCIFSIAKNRDVLNFILLLVFGWLITKYIQRRPRMYWSVSHMKALRPHTIVINSTDVKRQRIKI